MTLAITSFRDVVTIPLALLGGMGRGEPGAVSGFDQAREQARRTGI